ncbi:afeba8d1-975c-4fcb-a194-1f752cfe998c [Sclerotinia trifoliorum]|uniref:Afeba8d1-975c-4fcb-a194-1f752cfe998c n=1 Tax=Sclerotinia trifoliorum TaxID=28548 RepID=A0A8H2VUG7_9HELO|nr:afeba8d1-975c-4fcb-a194-1f752cfe998c [Sclerotinia trifoliorum]
MHITLTPSLLLLSIFTYSSAALIRQQGFQNSLEFSVDKEPPISATAAADFKTFVQSPVFALPSHLASPDSEDTTLTSQPSSTIAIDRRDDAVTNFAEQVNPRNLREGGFNMATWSPTAFAVLAGLTPFETPTPLPSITANPTFSEEFMTPTTTFTTTIMYSTIYYTVRDVARGESSTTTVPLSRAPPQTLQTITASPALASGT